MAPAPLLQELDNRIRDHGGTYADYSRHYLRRHRARYAHDLALIARLPGRKILEIGSFPHHVPFLLKRKGYDVTAVDLEPDRLKEFIAAERLPVIRADIERERLPFADESFDIVLLNGVFEHFLHPIHALLEANRVLRQGGALMLTVPNLYYFPKIMLYLLGKGAMSDAFTEFRRTFWLHHMGHVRDYHAREIKRFLEYTNFIVRRVTYPAYEKTRLNRFWPLSPLARLATALVPPLRPYIAVIARKGNEPRTTTLQRLRSTPARYDGL